MCGNTLQAVPHGPGYGRLNDKFARPQPEVTGCYYTHNNCTQSRAGHPLLLIVAARLRVNRAAAARPLLPSPPASCMHACVLASVLSGTHAHSTCSQGKPPNASTCTNSVSDVGTHMVLYSAYDCTVGCVTAMQAVDKQCQLADQLTQSSNSICLGLQLLDGARPPLY